MTIGRNRLQVLLTKIFTNIEPKGLNDLKKKHDSSLLYMKFTFSDYQYSVQNF